MVCPLSSSAVDPSDRCTDAVLAPEEQLGGGAHPAPSRPHSPSSLCGLGVSAVQPSSLPQLDQFLSLLEYIGSHPEQIYRPARVAAALGYSPSRVRRWLILLVSRRWLVSHGKNYLQSGLFKTWGDDYAARIIMK